MELAAGVHIVAREFGQLTVREGLKAQVADRASQVRRPNVSFERLARVGATPPDLEVGLGRVGDLCEEAYRLADDAMERVRVRHDDDDSPRGLEPGSEASQQGHGIVHAIDQVARDDRVERLVRLVGEDICADVGDAGIPSSELPHELEFDIEAGHLNVPVSIEPIVPDTVAQADVEDSSGDVRVERVSRARDVQRVDLVTVVAVYCFVFGTGHECLLGRGIVRPVV